MKQAKILGLAIFFFASVVFLSSCSIDTENFSGNIDTIRENLGGYISGDKEAINQAKEVKNKIEDSNPVFTVEDEVEPQDQTTSQVNEIVKRALGGVFTDVKMISAGNSGSTPFIMKYIVKRKIYKQDGEALHKVLVDAGSQAKDDAMPNYYETRNAEEFSVYHNFGGRSYILAVVMDLTGQVIWVNVY